MKLIVSIKKICAASSISISNKKKLKRYKILRLIKEKTTHLITVSPAMYDCDQRQHFPIAAFKTHSFINS